MTIPDGYIDLPPGKMANVVTCLEMRARPAGRAEPPATTVTLERVENPGLEWYRAIFRSVGAPHLWFSRLALGDASLAAIVHDPLVEIYAVRRDGGDIGLVELDFRIERECEIVFFGVVPAAVGHGIGRWLMNRSIDRAWSHPIDRLWVHTCTLDHPGAVAFYERSGFRPYKRQIEISDDPRLNGLLPRDAAPDIPLI